MFSYTSKPIHNTGGIIRVYFTPSDNIIEELPVRLPSPVITNEIQLKAGAQWYELKGTKFTFGYKQTMRRTKYGPTYGQRLEGIVAKYSPELISFFAPLQARRFAAVLHDFNNNLTLIGGKKYGLQWANDYESGNTPPDRNQISFTLEGESVFPALFYHGNLFESLSQTGPPDFGDISVQPRVMEDGVSIRILE